MNNNKAIKNNRGNVTIMVLIIGLVIIMAITALTQFMFRDIDFTRLDESKLKALNIAEAGIASMLSNIEKFYGDESETLPSSPYISEVLDSDNNVQGSYTVTYEEIYNDEDILTNYIITSKGADEGSGQTRTVKVDLAVSFSTEIDIFDYIYSKGSLEFFDIFTTSFINGPIYVAGDLVIRDLLSFSNAVTGGKVLVGGNLEMEGRSRITAGPINVAGDIEMSSGLFGLSPYIHHNFDDPLIVMGDIRIDGSPYIARDSTRRPINLSLHGEIIPPSAGVYYTPPIGNDIFDPPRLNVEVYVNDFIDQIHEPPIDVWEIAKGDMTNGVFVIDPDMLIGEPSQIFFRGSGDNFIRFRKSGSNYYLDISGNVQVNGDIEIDEDTAIQRNTDIYYSGKGKLIATGNINVLSGLVPNPISGFPVSNLLILMAAEDLNISVDNYNHNPGDYNDPDVRILGIAGGTALLSSYNAVMGSLISNQIDASNASGLLGMLLGSRASIGYQSNISDNIPEDLPRIVKGGATFTTQWEEVIN